MRKEILIRFIVGAILCGGGWGIGILVANSGNGEEATNEGTWSIALAIAFFVCGFLFAPYFSIRPWRWTQRKFNNVPTHSLIAIAIGLAFSLVITALAALPLSMIPGKWGDYSPLILGVFLICLMVPVMIMQGPSVLQFFSSAFPSLSKGRGGSDMLLLDTNAIIDGRIADIVQTGFIKGTLVIPRFILNELHLIADSSDSMRRTRGKRGLDMLTKIQKGKEIPVQISDVDYDDIPQIDSKLVKLAKSLRSPIISNDTNLNRVAVLQGIKVLNINELANALKPVILPGEEMTLRVVQEGKETGQGVGFLDDGTMVVIEGGRQYLNSDISISITRVLQTSAGRMIFAQAKGYHKDTAINEHSS